MSHGHSARVVSQEDILYEFALKRRCQWRVAACALLCLMGLLSIGAAIYPIILKSAIPIMWINEANATGWNTQLQSIGIHLLAKGRIEAYPLWMSMASSSVGCVLIWAGATIFRLRHENAIWSTFLTRSFWTKVYAWNQVDEVISVKRAGKLEAKK